MRAEVTRLFRKNIVSLSVAGYLDSYYATYTPPKRIVYGSEIKDEKLPDGRIPELSWKFSQLLTRTVPEAFVLTLPGATVYGGDGAVITREQILLRDVSREFGSRHKHSVQRNGLRGNPEKRNATVAVLATAGGSTFYHWLFDIVPRVHLIRKAGLFSAVDFFVIPPLVSGYQRELLAIAGIEPNKLIEARDSTFYLEARELIVPSLPADLGTVTGWAVEYIRNLFVGNTPKENDSRKRLYLTRRNAVNRKMKEEEKLVPLLGQYGFEIVEPERMSLPEQAALFQSAEVIMGPHGSGFSNLVFCNPGTKVIELFSSDFVVPCFWILANQNRLDYYCSFDRGTDSLPLQPYWHGSPSDLNFSKDHLEQILTAAGLSQQPINP